MHPQYFFLAFSSIYLILAERGIIKLPFEKRQREFEQRMSNKWPDFVGFTTFNIVILAHQTKTCY